MKPSALAVALSIPLFAGLLFAQGSAPPPASAPEPHYPAAPSASAPRPPALAAPVTAAAPMAAGAPSIGAWIPPEEPSPRPKGAEWEAATPLALLRPHDNCTARALREWVQITCRDPRYTQVMGLRVIAGAAADVEISQRKFDKDPADPERPTVGTNVMFPVRRGDRRLLSLNESMSAGWKSFTIEEDTVLVISELWLPGDRGPTLVVH